MFVLGLITCVALTAFSAQAKVVDSFEECKEFFYQGIEPSGMDQNAEKICQKWENGRFYYATLYSVNYKIPLYSAYTLDPKCSTKTEMKIIWHLEPQIFNNEFPIDCMVPDNKNNQNLYKENQAISSDYTESGYDRGHLNPSSFQCGDGRKATFTLTNAAPMDPCFNRVHWNNWERKLRSFLLKKKLQDQDSATAFIVTGTVPDASKWIPHRTTPVRVSVPSHIWTAVCYKHHYDDTKSFSFGYIGRNWPEEPDIRLMSVSDLNGELRFNYRLLSRFPLYFKIFDNNCFDENNKLHLEVQGVFQKLVNLQGNQAVQKSSSTHLAVNKADRGDSLSIYSTNIDASQMTVKLAFDGMSTYYNVAEDLKVFAGSACLITNAKPLGKKQGDLRKREVSTRPEAVECQLVPEKKTAADGSLCSRVLESDYSCQCNTEGKIKLCCTSPCLYQGDLKGYGCYSDQKLIECSPPYSLITYKGQKCLDNHPCATYGEDYYWCKTTAGSWDYCSPPLRNSKTKNGKDCRINHACAKYGYDYLWCYTDDEGNWDYC